MKRVSLLAIIFFVSLIVFISNNSKEAVVQPVQQEEGESEETNETESTEPPKNDEAKKPKTRPQMYSFEFAAIKETWVQVDHDRFLLHYLKDTKAEEDIDQIVEELNKQYDYLADTFGPHPNKIKIYIHPYYDTGGYLGIAFTTKSILHVGYEQSFARDIRSTGTHELTHIFSANWSNSPNIVLTEGIAEYFESLYNEKDIDKIARLETKNNNVSVLTLSKIYTNEWDNDYGYSYKVAGSFVKYLIDTYGIEKFEEMYKDKYVDFEVGFEQVYERKLHDVEKAWLAKIHNQ